MVPWRLCMLISWSVVLEQVVPPDQVVAEELARVLGRGGYHLAIGEVDLLVKGGAVDVERSTLAADCHPLQDVCTWHRAQVTAEANESAPAPPTLAGPARGEWRGEPDSSRHSLAAPHSAVYHR
jgi:hypothetical protein